MSDDGALLPLLRAVLLFAVAALLYPPLAWLDRWARRVPGDPTPVPKSPIVPLANAFKLLEKRAALPSSADRVAHVAAPLVGIIASGAALATIPLAPPVEGARALFSLDVANGEGTLPFALALLFVATAAIAVTGWAGANRLALLGALHIVLLRVAALVIVALGTAGVCLLHGTLFFDELVLEQAQVMLGPLPGLGLLVNPVGFFCAVVALAVLGQRVAKSRPDERADLVEPYAAEAAGPALLAQRAFEIVDLLATSALLATVFLGGWLVPLVDGGGVTALPPGEAALRLFALALKILLAASLILVVRRSLPPLRHDQAQSLAWGLVVVTAIGFGLSSAVFARFL